MGTKVQSTALQRRLEAERHESKGRRALAEAAACEERVKLGMKTL